MANTNATVINCFSVCGHVAYLYELTHHLYTEPRYVFTDEVLTPKEKDDGYDFEFNMSYISEVYDSKEEAESKFNKLKYAYLFDAHAMFPDECKNIIVIPIRSDLNEKYMDSIMDKIVEITSIVRTDVCSLNDYEAGFSIEFDLKFKIDGIEFNAKAYTIYGDYMNGKNPYINISIYKDKAFTAYVTDEFNLCYNKEDINFTTAKIKSDNNIIAIDIGQIDDLIGSRYGIPETLNINLTSLGRFLVNRVYQEINDIISKVEQKV